MGIIDKLRHFSQSALVSAQANSAIKAYQQLGQERDLARIPSLADEVQNRSGEAIKGLGSMGLRDDHSVCVGLRVARLCAGCAKAFVGKDFAAALALAQEHLDDPSAQIRLAGVNQALDALGQVKASMLASGQRQAYDDAFGESEAQLRAAGWRLGSEADASGGIVKFSAAQHGLMMGVGLLAWVGGDVEGARLCAQASAARNGPGPVRDRELGEPQSNFWFYGSVDRPSWEGFREMLAQVVEPDRPRPPAPR